MADLADTGFAGGILDRQRTVARPGFNRWLVPPAALAIHLCIGMSYGLSVFWLPLSKAIGIDKPAACPADMGLFGRLFTTTCDWQVTDLLVVFTIGIVVLGISAALFGGWLERAGPRKAGFAAMVCWAGGFAIGSLGVYLHQLWLIWLGMGFIGGIGLGLGYISPVSTLVKWFPDRRGMATGMAIMGFGGGAMIGAPFANELINHFKSATSVGVVETLAVMAAVYAIAMTAGAFGYRVPPANWRPDGWTAPPQSGGLISQGDVDLKDAHKTPQFWMVWVVLCMNVSAGIGVLAMASPMLQEIFGSQLIGLPGLAADALTPEQKTGIATVAAGFVGLLSLFNICGRFFWASLSDRIGRKITYLTFFALGILLYAATPTFAHWGSLALFVGAFCIILSMYGGGFATVPAYLADLFGTRYVGAIHGRLLTAWSTAGVIGPLLIGYLRDAQLAAGVEKALVYDRTMYILAGLLIVGLIANALVRPVDPKWHIPGSAGATVKAAGGAKAGSGSGIDRGRFDAFTAIIWLIVAVPVAWGVYRTLLTAWKLF